MSSVSAEPTRVPAVVVGAGPAGMAAAVALAETGVPVTVLDTYNQPGGQYHRASAVGPDAGRLAAAADAPSGADTRVAADAPTGSREDPTVAAFRHHLGVGTVHLRSATAVWSASAEGEGFVLRLTDAADAGVAHTAAAGAATTSDPDPGLLHAEVVIVATGATDRVLPFPGWDLPGVFTAGGAQALLKGQGVRVGERAVVAGSGPFLLPVATALAEAGTTVAAVAEAQHAGAIAREARRAARHLDVLTEGLSYARTLARHRVPVRHATAVTAAAGDGRVEEVTLQRLDERWSPVPGTDERVAVDAACVSFGFVPQVGLPALLGCALTSDPVWGDPVVVVDTHQHTSVDGVFAAGESTGVGGAALAAEEGALAGLAAAHALGAIDLGALRDRGAPHRRARARKQAFAATLGRMYRRGEGWVHWLDDDTIVCRCEEVDHAAVRHAVCELGAVDQRSVKLTTRCGMGLCQARMCGDAVAALVAHHSGEPADDLAALSTPTVLAPVRLRDVATLAATMSTPGTTTDR